MITGYSKKMIEVVSSNIITGVTFIQHTEPDNTELVCYFGRHWLVSGGKAEWVKVEMTVMARFQEHPEIICWCGRRGQFRGSKTGQGNEQAFTDWTLKPP